MCLSLSLLDATWHLFDFFRIKLNFNKKHSNSFSKVNTSSLFSTVVFNFIYFLKKLKSINLICLSHLTLQKVYISLVLGWGLYCTCVTSRSLSFYGNAQISSLYIDKKFKIRLLAEARQFSTFRYFSQVHVQMIGNRYETMSDLKCHP